ncbi:MAG: nucleotide pyrophosphatase/phosphodiesterase family protein [Mycobacterium sp.]
MTSATTSSALPQPDPSQPRLADVVPAVLTAMGVTDFAPRLDIGGEIRGACVLLIDGLGDQLLDAHSADAPVLAGLRGRTLEVGFPSTTAAGLAAVGTGTSSGEHGLVGYSFRIPGSGVVNALRWRPHPWGPDLRDELVPEDVQPLATTFERAAAAGIAVSVVSGAQFDGSGLTRAVLRGGTYIGVHALGDLAARVRQVIDEGGFCYGYHSELDMVGHLYGPGSPAWRMQLRQVDRLVESVIEGLPPGGLLAVVADHGMITTDPGRLVDLDSSPDLLDGVHDLGGEPRARHVYTADGAGHDVLDTWRHVLADHAWVAGRDEAIAAGWFGQQVSDRVRQRIGDIVVAARDSAVLVRRTVEPLESGLIGHHGSLTPAEQQVPLLLARG